MLCKKAKRDPRDFRRNQLIKLREIKGCFLEEVTL